MGNGTCGHESETSQQADSVSVPAQEHDRHAQTEALAHPHQCCHSSDKLYKETAILKFRRSPLKLAPWGQTPPFLDTEWGALKKAYKMDGHKEFAWIQNGRAQSEP